MRFKYKQYTKKHACYIMRDNLRNFPGDFPSTHNWQAYWQYIFFQIKWKKAHYFQHPKTVHALILLANIRFNCWEVKSFNCKGTVVRYVPAQCLEQYYPAEPQVRSNGWKKKLMQPSNQLITNYIYFPRLRERALAFQIIHALTRRTRN